MRLGGLGVDLNGFSRGIDGLREQRFETIGLCEQSESEGIGGFPLDDDIQLADGLIDVAGIEENASVVGVGLQVIGVQTDRFFIVTAGAVEIEERAVSAAQIEGGTAVGRVGGEGALE